MLGAFLLDHQKLFVLELLLVLMAIAVALLWPARRPVPLGQLERMIGGWSARPWSREVVVLVLAVGLRAALLPVLGPPAPYFPDEFSILLQGQTFAMGRLANPSHPLYPFFETIYVNQLPKYASIYFPGRGAPLALGILLGHPWIGVWLTMALLALAMVWMLRAWMSPGLALVGGILVVLRYGVVSGWINSYYGGSLTALGGVLVLGAFPRLMAAPLWRDGIALGLGLAFLMTTRPFEGLFFALPFLIVGGWRVIKALGRGETHGAARMALPTVVLTGIGAAILLANNLATTGDALSDPYSKNREEYGYYPSFLFGQVHQPIHPVPQQIDAFYKTEAVDFESRETISGLVGVAVEKLKRMLNFYVGPVFIIPFLIGLIRGRRTAILWVSSAALMFSFMLSTWHWSQYVSPGFGLFFIFIMLGLDGLRNFAFRGRPAGLVLTRLLPCIVALLLGLPVAGLIAGKPDKGEATLIRPCCVVYDQSPRSRIIRQLQDSPGQDLVIYRADPAEQRALLTMVANEPDIDHADIVWAHDRGLDNKRLLDYYPGRKVWLVEGFDAVRAIPVTDLAQVLQPLPSPSPGVAPPPGAGFDS